ncbi:MAG TPA: glycosyltransferase family 87 protein [Verrucomicrobiae bacterium]|nr:glycosyltransferase family 87 protein [Verrucomicrobiae bacterium]
MNGSRYNLKRLRGALMAGLGVGLAVTAIHSCATFLPERMFKPDFAHFYLSAGLLRRGTDVYAVPLHEYARHIGFPTTDLMERETNPPFLMWLLRPLAAVPIATAFWCYVTIEVASLVVIFGIAWHVIRGRLSAGAWTLALGLTLFSYPVLYHLWLSQVQLPLLAVVMLGYWLWRRGWNGWAIVAFALAGTAKLFPLVFVPLPALAERGRERLRLSALAFAAVLGFATVATASAWISFFNHALPLLQTFAERVRSNYTVPFLIGRLSEGMLPVPGFALVAEMTSAVAVGGFAWWCCSRASRPKTAVNQDSAFCLLLVASLVASPIAWAHYFVFMIYPLLRVSAEIAPARGLQRVWLVVLVVVSLLAFNTADTEPVITVSRWLSVAANNAPVFVLGLLYLHFARLTVRQPAGVDT